MSQRQIRGILARDALEAISTIVKTPKHQCQSGGKTCRELRYGTVIPWHYPIAITPLPELALPLYVLSFPRHNTAVSARRLADVHVQLAASGKAEAPLTHTLHNGYQRIAPLTICTVLSLCLALPSQAVGLRSRPSLSYWQLWRCIACMWS